MSWKTYEKHKFGKDLILKFGTPKGFKTWEAKSWTKKGSQNLACQVLTIIITCVHVLENQGMKDVSLVRVSVLFFTPEVQSLSRFGNMELKNISMLGNVQCFESKVLKQQCFESKVLKQQAVHIVSLHSQSSW